MFAITLEGFGGTEKMRWTEVPTPEPGPGEVRIRTVAVGVNRADLLQRQGYYPPPEGVSELLGLE
ncbi:MAG: NAD(P)H-quinone oxidoreductase, partial [Brooklawnia sp.]